MATGILHAYTASAADASTPGIVHPADWLAPHAVAAGTNLNGFAHVGMVTPFAGLIASVPAGWLLCNGASLVRGDYQALFDAIGTTYGYADGTHFNLPDCRDKFVVGAKQDDASLPKASITGGLTQSYAPATAVLTHTGAALADHTLTHTGLAVGDHSASHSVALANHPTLQLTGTVGAQGTVGRIGTKVASLVVSAGAHAVTWPSLAAKTHTITQVAAHTITHGITQPNVHGTGAGIVSHSFTPPANQTYPVPVPAFLALAYMIRYA